MDVKRGGQCSNLKSCVIFGTLYEFLCTSGETLQIISLTSFRQIRICAFGE